MPTKEEEQQAAEFLKRAEIRTMRKDLKALREIEALKERDKIVKMKTLEEQIQESVVNSPKEELAGLKKVLQANANQERLAEKDLKNYATEQERQQIFIIEAQRLDLEKQIDVIDQEKDPALKLEKNQLLLKRKEEQSKLDAILAQEQKIQNEQKAITDREQATTIPAEKKTLEQSRWDLDKRLQETEKKRWAQEKQLQDIDEKIRQTNKSTEQLVIEKNILRDKILGADKSLREIYSTVMVKEEEKRKGRAQEQITQKEALATSSAQRKEEIRREQWSGKPSGMVSIPVPVPKRAQIKQKLAESFSKEDEDRKKFIQKIEQNT